MNGLLIAIFLPLVCGLIIPLLKSKKVREGCILAVVLLNSIIIMFMVFNDNSYELTLIKINAFFEISFYIEGVGKVFAFLISLLWPIATLYAFSYMKKEKNQASFFRYYTITYGIVAGVAFSKNLITMYLFYELLTFVTLPIIMHEMDKKSIAAGRIYLIVSIFGAAMSLVGIFMLTHYSSNTNFIFGGVLNGNNLGVILNTVLVAYILCFFGFGVKSAILPFMEWLPKCSVAPTPVTALLHAVAVVKAGVFAIIRVTYYSFGVDILKGTYAQSIILIVAMISILYGSSMALIEQDIKRRLAYSTASNLSYILLAIGLMTTEGLKAGLTHMLFHGIIKITLFFVAGSFIVNVNIRKVNEVRGLSKYMPKTIFVWLVASLGLIGVPFTCGFISKLNLLSALIDYNSILSNIGLAVIIVSAILTCIYLFTITVLSYMPEKSYNNSIRKDTDILMLIPYIILIVLIIFFGMNSDTILGFIDDVAKGGI